MRISSAVLGLSAFVVAAILSYFAAQAVVSVVEDRSVIAVRERLVDAGHDWASVQGDGLQVILEGSAPSEALRFRAISSAGSIVDSSRVIDNMDVTASAALMAPDFSIEMLRNDSGVFLIGLIPADTDREAVSARISRAAGESNVSDLLQTADYPVPDGWRPAFDFGLTALATLPRATISVKAGQVEIEAISDSAEQKHEFETALRRAAPDGVDFMLDISAPRPVITPYTIRFSLDGDQARFDACSADTAETTATIMAAARAAGLTGRGVCAIGLGMPSKTWGATVALAINSVHELGGGTLTFSDTEITLVAVEGTAQGAFDRVVGQLEHALPDVFALDAILPQIPDVNDAGPPQFTATLSPEGQVQIRGKISDAMMTTVATNYAQARFGADHVTMGTRIDASLPAGWNVRVLAGIEVLSELSNGSILVEPNKITVRGNTGNQGASDDISALLISKLGEAAPFDLDVTYVEQLDPIAGLPTAAECIAQIEALTAVRKITFEPSSATIDASAAGLVGDIADILKRCQGLKIEVAGYTDSQGREIMNQQLSQERANAVLTAIRARRVPTSNFVANGYGEADPIADNDTEDGREDNRRIEFRLIVPEPIVEVETGLEAVEAPLEAVNPETAPDTNAEEETPNE